MSPLCVFYETVYRAVLFDFTIFKVKTFFSKDIQTFTKFSEILDKNEYNRIIET